MATIEIKSKDGKKSGSHNLADKIANAKTSQTTIHRTVVAEMANNRQGTQSAKTRAEVRGGGKKPYKQKKTGNARQGTIRAPHFAHGGMALAVKPRDYEKKVNKRERQAAILAALADKANNGGLVLADQIVFAEPKTKDAMKMLAALGVAEERRLLIVLPQFDATTYKSFRNIANVTVKTAPSSSAEGKEAAKTDVFSARDLMVSTKVLMAADALKRVEEVWAK